MRGIRGAITVACNTPEAITGATIKLLQGIVRRNQIHKEDIVSVLFTVTDDLDAIPPAKAARELGWSYIPLFCAQEMRVKGGLPRCIRVLIHVNTNKAKREIKHVYLGEASCLRPDLTNGGYLS